MSSQDPVNDPLLVALPKRPGADLSSKMLFHDDEITDIAINEITGGRLYGMVYEVGQNEYKDGTKSDIIYNLKGYHTITTPPVLVEVQQKIDLQFLKKLTRYCLNINDLAKVEPAVMVFAIQGFSF